MRRSLIQQSRKRKSTGYLFSLRRLLNRAALDALLIQSVCPRLITWMMAKEYYAVPGIGWVFRTVGAIPVERSGRDLAATRAAMRALEENAVLGIFPEGRIETDRELLPFQT